jgi:hypothetical protein
LGQALFANPSTPVLLVKQKMCSLRRGDLAQ